MHIRSDRTYHLDAGPRRVWAALARVEDYRTWWPWLRRLDGAALEKGTRWECQVQPPVPYSLRFTLAITEVVPGERVAARLEGDIEGDAELALTADGDGSVLRLGAGLAPSSPWLRSVAVVAPGLVRFGHDWVLDTGIRQFIDGAF